MKKFLLPLVVAVFSLASCADYTDDFNTINNRLDALEQSVPTIEEQIESINAQLTSLKATDEAIKKQISELEKNDEATATEIADLKKKDSALEKSINDLQNYVDTQIANAKSEAAAAYATVEQYNAIVAQLNALQSYTSKLGEELTAKINAEVKSLTDKIADLEARLKAVEDKVENLLARIQSVSYIPKYEDGKATLKYAKRISQVELDFEIMPKSAVAELAKIWQNTVSAKAVYTETRAVSFIDMPIVKFETDEQNGVITITASGENLEQISSTQNASISLVISDGNSSVTSEYIPLMPKEIEIIDLVVPSNEIWYISTDDNIVESTRSDAFDVSIISNTYKDGMGIFRFNDSLTKIYLYAFCNQETQLGVSNLKTIAFPKTLEYIGDYAFNDCTSLTEVVIPGSVHIRVNAFRGCVNIKKVHISDLVSWCNCKFVNPTTCGPLAPGSAELFLNGEKVIDLIIPSSISKIGHATFAGCSSLNSVVIPSNITLICSYAFYNCKQLETVFCEPIVPPTIDLSDNGSWRAFNGNHYGRMIYVPRESVEAYKSADGWKDYADYIVGFDF